MTQTKTQTPTRVAFSQNVGFRKELNKRVDAYFNAENIKPRDNLAMYIKMAIILGWVISAWVFILFIPSMLWVKALACVWLGAGIAAAAMNIGHDANHGGLSNNSTVNYLVGLLYDVLGLSSYLWKVRHNFLHHTYTNILGYDVEIHGDGLVRMTPYMEHKWYHKLQHITTYLIYPFIPFYWSASDVFLILAKKKYYEHNIPTPKPLEMLILLGGKVIWLGLFLFLPMAVGYTPLQAIIGFTITNMVYGLIICIIFMLAHVMEEADFIQPNLDTNQIDDEWAIFQIKTTVDFAPNNKFVTWYLGGLNYQVVHHLFPQYCHIHYPKIALILADVCQDFGIKYQVLPTFREALASNYNLLKRMATVPN